MASSTNSEQPMERFAGKWKLVDSVNFRKYLKALEVSKMKEFFGHLRKQTLLVKVNGNHMLLVSKMIGKTVRFEFELGKAFEDYFADSDKEAKERKAVVTMDSSERLIYDQLSRVGSKWTISVEDGMLVFVYETKCIKATRKYKRAVWNTDYDQLAMEINEDSSSSDSD